MKSLSFLFLFSFSMASMASNDYLYFDYSTFSDDGAVTEHRFFKVKKPKNDQEVSCDLEVNVTMDNQKQDLDNKFRISFFQQNKFYAATIHEISNLLRSSELYRTSSDIRSKASDLFTSYTNSDGYTFEDITAGSMRNVLNSIELRSEGLEDTFPAGKIDKAFDLSKSNYNQDITRAQDVNGSYNAILSIKCDID